MKNSHCKKIFAGACATALAAFLAYLPSLHNGFVSWDDQAYVYANESLRRLDLWRFLTGNFAGNWHPLTMISLAVDYAVWGLDPFGYHLTNAVIHALNTGLVFLIATRLYGLRATDNGGRGGFMAGLAAALLFGLHPLRVESVAWVSERKDVLFFFFYALSVLVYLRYAAPDAARKARWYLAALALFVLSLLSKPMAVSLPLVLLVLDLYPLGRLENAQDAKKAVLEKIPFFAAAVALALVTVFTQQGALAPSGSVAFKVRVFTAVRAYAFYLYKTFLPAGLVPYYPLFPNASVLTAGYMAAFALFIAVTVLCVLTYKRTRLFAALWLFYVVTLLPASGIVQVGGQAVADRYTYLPGLAPVLLLAFGAARLSGAGRGARAAVTATLIGAAAVLSVLSVRQEHVWKDTVSLWTHEIDYYPVIFAYRARAAEYKKLGMTEKEIADYGVIIRTGGQDIDLFHIERARAFDSLGDTAAALKDLGAALAINPASVTALNNRGNVYRKTGDYKKAIADFQRAATLAPANAAVRINMALAYRDAGDERASIEQFREAARLGARPAQDYLRGKGMGW